LSARLTHFSPPRTLEILTLTVTMLFFALSATAQQKPDPVRFINPSTMEQNPRYTQIVEVAGDA